MSGTENLDPTTTAADGGSRPGLLVAAVAAVGVEVVTFVVFAVAVVVELVGGGSSNAGVSVFVAVFFLGLAVVLAACARALWQGRRSGRSVVMGWQVFQLLIGLALLTSGVAWSVWAGVLAAGAAAFVLVALMSRRVVEHTIG
jgi:hypothetical protein